MNNKVRALLLTLLMSLQALSWASPYQISEQAEQITHTIVHTQEISHHHHTDESLHFDDDSNSPAHHHPNSSSELPALEPSALLTFADPQSAAPIFFLYKDYTSVTLEGPLRPPRS